MRNLVIIESPYGGDIDRNTKYARACVKDCVERGESCFASHLFFTQEGILDENNKEERELGIELGYDIMERADIVAIYHNLGFSAGMLKAITRASQLNKPIEFRILQNWPSLTATNIKQEYGSNP